MFPILILLLACFGQTANEETKEHLYETLLAECRDTIQAVREELKSEVVRYCSLKMLIVVGVGQLSHPVY